MVGRGRGRNDASGVTSRLWVEAPLGSPGRSPAQRLRFCLVIDEGYRSARKPDLQTAPGLAERFGSLWPREFKAMRWACRLFVIRTRRSKATDPRRSAIA